MCVRVAEGHPPIQSELCGDGEPSVAAVTEPVALIADVEGGGVMEQAMEQRDGERGIGEDLVPLPEGFVGGEDDGLLGLVALVDDLEEEGDIGALEGQIAYLVYDKQLGPMVSR